MGNFETIARLTKDQPVWIEIPVEREVFEAVEQFFCKFHLSIEDAVGAYLMELVKVKELILQRYAEGERPEEILATIADRVLCELTRTEHTGGNEDV